MHNHRLGSLALLEKAWEEPSEDLLYAHTPDRWQSGYKNPLPHLNSVEELFIVVGDVAAKERDAIFLAPTNMPYMYFEFVTQQRTGLDQM